jgi:hypothetical protein
VPEISEWNQMAVHVQAELQRLADAQEKMSAEFVTFRIDMKEEVAALKIKSGLWGMLGAAMFLALALGVEYFKH